MRVLGGYDWGVGMTGSADADWGPWVLHDGKGCPCVGMHILGQYDEGRIVEAAVVRGNPQAWDWSVEPGKYHKVIRYRIRRPRALLELIQMIADLPAPVKTDGVIA